MSSAWDWWLTQTVIKSNEDTLIEFPVVSEMLALAVTAGEGPVGAIARISRSGRQTTLSLPPIGRGPTGFRDWQLPAFGPPIRS